MTCRNACRPNDVSDKRTSDSRSGRSRREFLAALAALAITATTQTRALIAQTAAVNAKPGLIDVHHHFFPPFYFAEHPDGFQSGRGERFLSWTPEQALAAMDKSGVATTVLSLTSGIFWSGDRQTATRMARRANEYAADVARTHRGRFGLFAIIPLPDTAASLREIEYAYGVLKTDGIHLLTNYDNKWLGHPDYLPVFEELNRRKAVVFVHPAISSCCRTLLPDVSPMVIEIPQDTARAVTNLLFTGTLAKFRDIRFIFAHAGGNVPMLLGRMKQYGPKDMSAKAPAGIEYELKRLHYDIAGTAFRPAIAALTSLVPTTQILFGSDNPFIPLADTAEGMMRLKFSANDLALIGRHNALTLLPRLKSS